jgi:hypothetical protein
MKTKHDDSPLKALALLPQAVPGDDRLATESSLSPVSCDLGELFVAEMQARRERLSHWLRLLSEEARLNGGCAPAPGSSRYKCRGERRLSARRHSTAA